MRMIRTHEVWSFGIDSPVITSYRARSRACCQFVSVRLDYDRRAIFHLQSAAGCFMAVAAL